MTRNREKIPEAALVQFREPMKNIPLDQPGRVEVVSDSNYVVNCFRDRWYEGWKRRGWPTSASGSRQRLD